MARSVKLTDQGDARIELSFHVVSMILMSYDVLAPGHGALSFACASHSAKCERKDVPQTPASVQLSPGEYR